MKPVDNLQSRIFLARCSRGLYRLVLHHPAGSLDKSVKSFHPRSLTSASNSPMGNWLGFVLLEMLLPGREGNANQLPGKTRANYEACRPSASKDVIIEITTRRRIHLPVRCGRDKTQQKPRQTGLLNPCSRQRPGFDYAHASSHLARLSIVDISTPSKTRLGSDGLSTIVPQTLLLCSDPLWTAHNEYLPNRVLLATMEPFRSLYTAVLPPYRCPTTAEIWAPCVLPRADPARASWSSR
ncbi:hypothetical protein BDW59DRAFT_54329 [Aspergillus cavernicola]|uniref:Uncharacterized protein n=1 Tax=Aspergillus cavernicola TaxID=176166 RepID=A0ABR4ILR2_9EURO